LTLKDDDDDEEEEFLLLRGADVIDCS